MSDGPDQIDSILEQALSNYSKQEPRPGFEDRVVKHVFDAGARQRFVFPVWVYALAAAAVISLVPVAWIYHHLTPAVSQLAIGRAQWAPPDKGVGPQGPKDAPGSAPANGDRKGMSNRSRPAKGNENQDHAGLDHSLALVTRKEALALGGRREFGPSRAQRAPRQGADGRPARTFHGAGLAYVSELPKQRQFPAPSPITDEERALLILAASAPDEALRISMDQAQPGIAPIKIETIHIKPLQIDGLQQGAE
jgi:hypothetical protein